MLLALVSASWAGTMKVHMLDVGQGDSILLQTPAGDNILIDAGPRKAQVHQQLKTLGVSELDLVFASHAHADHIGGMQDVVENLHVREYIDSGMPHTTQSYENLMRAVADENIPARRAMEGEVIELDDGIRIHVLWPGQSYLRGTRSDLNSNSVVLRVEHGQDCILLMGDAEEPTEHKLNQGGLEPCGVLKVAHHGSDHSTTPSFLRQVEPEIALISAGVDNRYGHPGEGTLANLQRAEATIYRTDFWGTITLASTGSGVEVTDGRPWWEPGGAQVASGPSLPAQPTLAAQGPVLQPAAQPANAGSKAEPEAPEQAPAPVGQDDPHAVDPAALSGVRDVQARAEEESPEPRGWWARRRARREERRKEN